MKVFKEDFTFQKEDKLWFLSVVTGRQEWTCYTTSHLAEKSRKYVYCTSANVNRSTSWNRN